MNRRIQDIIADLRELAGKKAPDRDAVAEVYRQMAEVETSRLREAAAKLWAQSFGTPLPALELIAR